MIADPFKISDWRGGECQLGGEYQLGMKKEPVQDRLPQVARRCTNCPFSRIFK